MKQKAALIGCLFLLIALSATGSTGRDVAVPHAMSAMHVQKCTQTANGYTLSISFDEPTLKTLDEAESLQLATLTGRGMRLNPGEPATPLAGGLFRLPPGGGVTVEVLDTEYYTLPISTTRPFPVNWTKYSMAPVHCHGMPGIPANWPKLANRSSFMISALQTC